jgi:hypothetical protein
MSPWCSRIHGSFDKGEAKGAALDIGHKLKIKQSVLVEIVLCRGLTPRPFHFVLRDAVRKLPGKIDLVEIM